METLFLVVYNYLKSLPVRDEVHMHSITFVAVVRRRFVKEQHQVFVHHALFLTTIVSNDGFLY